MKRFNTITSIVDTGLITSTVITGGVGIAAFANGVVVPFGIAWSETSQFCLSCDSQYAKIFWNIYHKARKQEKHHEIKLPAQTKLDSIAKIILHAMQNRDIGNNFFRKW